MPIVSVGGGGVGGSSSGFFFTSGGVVVVFGDGCVSAVVVGTDASSVAVMVVSVAGSGRNTCGGDGVETRGRSGRGNVVDVIGAGCGTEPAIAVPAVSLASGFGLFASVKLVVVSALVSVSGAGVSPGPLIVDVTPLADPSGTTSYCF